MGSSAHSGQIKQCQLGGTTLYVNVAQRLDGSDFKISTLVFCTSSSQASNTKCFRLHFIVVDVDIEGGRACTAYVRQFHSPLCH